jgi:hypothetical protein
MIQKIDLSKYEGVTELSFEKTHSIDGGSFWYDAAYLIGAAAKGLYAISLGAKDYYNLPPEMKK